MPELNLEKFKPFVKIKNSGSGHTILDPVRKKYIVFQPEELVRQLLIQYLTKELSISLSLIAVEREIIVNSMKKRFDLLVYNKESLPVLLAECKAPDIVLNQKVFDQIAIYNLPFRVPYLLVTNGIGSYCCQMDYHNSTYHFIDNMQSFKDKI